MDIRKDQFHNSLSDLGRNRRSAHVTAVAPKFSDTLTLFQPGGADSTPTLQRLDQKYPHGYISAILMCYQKLHFCFEFNVHRQASSSHLSRILLCGVWEFHGYCIEIEFRVIDFKR